VEADERRRGRRPERRAAQSERVLAGQRLRERAGVGIAARALEEEQRARDDAERLLDPLDDRADDLLAGSRGGGKSRSSRETGASSRPRSCVAETV